MQIDRQDLVHELNISYRDVRILDPLVRLSIPRSWAAVKQRPQHGIGISDFYLYSGADAGVLCEPQVATPYPTALLIREKALVVNIEAVRMIICKDQCFVSGPLLLVLVPSPPSASEYTAASPSQCHLASPCPASRRK